MCGIVGYIGREGNASEVLIDGLRRLEYRGYDSAGVAIFDGDVIDVRRAEGKLMNLEGEIRSGPDGDLPARRSLVARRLPAEARPDRRPRRRAGRSRRARHQPGPGHGSARGVASRSRWRSRRRRAARSSV